MNTQLIRFRNGANSSRPSCYPQHSEESPLIRFHARPRITCHVVVFANGCKFLNTKLVALLLYLGLVVVTTVWGDIGVDVLATLTNGNREAMRRIDELVGPAAQEGNRVAQAVAYEARIALGQDMLLNRLWINSTPPPGLYDDTEKEWLVAVEKKAADGDPFFMDVMGYLYFNGYAGVSKDRQKAVAWWKQGAESNGGLAKLRLGICYLHGDGIQRNLEKAAMYSREAGESGIPMGWYVMGCLYNGEYGWSPRDIRKAMECWAKSAPMGHARSQHQLGYYYCFGDESVPVNKELGTQWMKAAATNGDQRARLYLQRYVEKPFSEKLPVVIEDRNTCIMSTVIAFDKIKESIAGPKVSIVCFVDFYEPNTVSPRDTISDAPSEVLDIYLRGVRTLKRQQPNSFGANTVNAEDVKIFIVECNGGTIAKVREFNKQYQLKSYDGTIPVLYVFNSGRPVGIYTYHLSEDIKKLKSLVEGLLTTKL